MEKVVLICLLLLSGCSGYQIQDFKFTENRKSITLKIMNVDEINKVSPWKEHIGGFAKWTSDACVIYIPPPNGERGINTLLHELYHCQEGMFHPMELKKKE